MGSTGGRSNDRAGDGAGSVPVVEAAQLLAGGRELVILHNGERYRLRITQNGKLILTK